jgi:alpha-glutamyl/putrescinyl thymine pyrophosphorylase clade 1
VITTIAFETYWRFAAERLNMFYRRRIDPAGPWTSDPILRLYRFTNTFRVTDRVSQYLIREVQYRSDRSQEPAEVFFRTLLFKIFNKIETWEALETSHGPLEWRSVDLPALDHSLTLLRESGQSIYSAAYIMPAPSFGRRSKHSNHLALIARMMSDGLPSVLRRATSLESVYKAILAYPGVGRFLAFQYTIDLNYSTLLDFDESDFVVAGPGALDGISKCFGATDGLSPEAIIHWMTERQDIEFTKRGIDFQGLFRRPLQPIDCQNVFCEISKYTRVAHPELPGIANRQRIKQTYKPTRRRFAPLAFPPRWNLRSDVADVPAGPPSYDQLSLL